ncbi:polyprotein [Rice chlorotic stripe virus]|nr:polyprotein [Rice chlorotic stripe virus]
MAMPVIYFGDFPTALGGDARPELEPEDYLLASDAQFFACAQISDYDYKVRTAFAKFEVTPPIQELADPVVTPTDYQEQDENQLVTEPYVYRKTLHHPRIKERVKGNVDNLMRYIRNNARPDQTVQVIGKKAASFQRTTRKRVWRAHVAHLHGFCRTQDFPSEPIIDKFVDACAQLSLPVVVTHGNSGEIYQQGTSNIIIRGSLDGRLVDAREYVPENLIMKLEHYSEDGLVIARSETATAYTESAALDLSDGYSTASIAQHFSLGPAHICDKDHPQLLSGELSEHLYRAIFQCIDLRCLSCIRQSAKRDAHAVRTQLQEDSIFDFLHSDPKWMHINKVLTNLAHEDRVLVDNTALENAVDLIKDSDGMQFKHLKDIILSIMQLSSGDNIALRNVHTPLLELARHLKKAQERRQLEAQRFRNPYTPRPLQYSQIIADNLVAHGDTEFWGTNAIVMLKLYNQFYEVCEDTESALETVWREYPSGWRKLATELLMVDRDPQTYREKFVTDFQGQGTSLHACVARNKTSIVHSISCTTDEVGVPQESTIVFPAPGHTFIDGDDLIRMPQGARKLCSARNGYCYMNIFMSMFTQVQSLQAEALYERILIAAEKLGAWPTVRDVATCCTQITMFLPATREAGIPRLLVDHNKKIVHVIDMFGSLTTGYHVLHADTVKHFMLFAEKDIQSHISEYRIGGNAPTLRRLGNIRTEIIEEEQTETPTNTNPIARSDIDCLKALIRASLSRKRFERVLEEDPYLILYAVLSPYVLSQLFSSGSLEIALKHFITINHDLRDIVGLLNELTTRTSTSKHVVYQFYALQGGINEILNYTTQRQEEDSSSTLHEVATHIQVLKRTIDANLTLVDEGYLNAFGWRHMREKMLAETHDQYVRELPFCARLRYRCKSYRSTASGTIDLSKRTITGLPETLNSYTHHYLGKVNRSAAWICAQPSRVFEAGKQQLCNIAQRGFISTLKSAVPNLSTYLGLAAVISALFSALAILQHLFVGYRRYRKARALREQEEKLELIAMYYNSFCNEHNLDGVDQLDELYDYIRLLNPSLADYTQKLFQKQIKLQGKTELQIRMEKVIAFSVLVMMYFDSIKSDVLYNTLNKVKGVFSTLGQDVLTLQAEEKSILDTYIRADEDEDRGKLQFTLREPETPKSSLLNDTFENYWSTQLSTGRTTPHFWSVSNFVEFTREAAEQVVKDIATSETREITVRGPVGSGKSTGLPYKLSKMGKVLMLEPTRPLAQNVWQQLGTPQWGNLYATLKMRNHISLGDPNLTIMTTGYAFQYFANNAYELKTFNYILLDECHVSDAYANAFVALYRQLDIPTKILYVSATPVGQEAPFTPPHPVEVITVKACGLTQFAQNQGTGCDSDALVHGNNILVYVASYNDVDNLGSELNKRGYKTTLVDGRTMKKGLTSIDMTGTPGKPHFCVATNIIENGVTLDIEVVVDFGMKIVPRLDPDNRMITYQREAVTYGERIQRSGRVGRHKPGAAMKIGATQPAPKCTPEIVATEAAFLCFAHNLPLMTVNVEASMLANCTRQQAKTMAMFELPIFFTKHLVHHDGTMHPAIASVLKPYLLGNTLLATSEAAMPWNAASTWLTAEHYGRLAHHLDLPAETRIPFFTHEVSPKVYKEIWEAILKNRPLSSCVYLRSVSSHDVLVTLKSDPASVARSLKHVNELLVSEQIKQHELQGVLQGNSLIPGALTSIATRLRGRYLRTDHEENIKKLNEIKHQLEQCQTFTASELTEEMVRRYAGLGVLTLQSREEYVKHLGLRNTYDGRKIQHDIMLGVGVALGSALLLFEYARYTVTRKCYLEADDTPNASDFFQTLKEHQKQQRELINNLPEDKRKVTLEGLGKRARQKQQYRKQRERKELVGDADRFDESYKAYGKQGKKKQATQTNFKHRFVNMYGFAPDEYQFFRFLDPVTGYTYDYPVQGLDFEKVCDDFKEIREELDEDCALQPGKSLIPANLKVYAVNLDTKKALQFDVSQHDSDLRTRTGLKQGFDSHNGELRQSGGATQIEVADVPKPRIRGTLQLEGKSVARGPIDIKPISNHIVHVNTKGENDEQGPFSITLRGIMYGDTLLVPSHAFKKGVQYIKLTTNRGEFIARYDEKVFVTQVDDRDLLLIKVPRDVPLFSKALKFRPPTNGERVAILDVSLDGKEPRPKMSEASYVFRDSQNLWTHSISTQVGHCGCPVVAMKDLAIVGIHTATVKAAGINYFTTFPNMLIERITDPTTQWETNWCFNPDLIDWGGMILEGQQDAQHITPERLMQALQLQSFEEDTWFTKHLNANLMQMGIIKNNMVTKHVIRGKNPMFAMYLSLEPEAEAFFSPFLSHYKPSRLNKEAFIKDILKYATPIPVGQLDYGAFEIALERAIIRLKNAGITECKYVTDTQEIVESLNMDAATGVQYGGKKKAFFENWDMNRFEEYHIHSMRRLYDGKMGIWNGSLKAELRPNEKVDANKTRVYTAAPVDVLFAAKTCVDDFNNQFYTHHLSGPWTVGISKFHNGWDTFLRSFPDGWTICHADGSQFDSSLTPYLINGVCRIRKSFMDNWDIGEQMLDNLYAQIVYTPIATPDGSVIKKMRGNNSGQPSTVVDNTLMVIIAMEYACVKRGITMEQVVYFANGDDLAIGIQDENEHFFDTLAQDFSELGLKYTFEHRTRNRSDVDFMSHAGILRDDKYIPKLDIERIVAILEWQRTDVPEHELSALMAAMIESYGYDELEMQIRKYYAWLLGQHPYSELARCGKAPYLSRMALKNLYTSNELTDEEIEIYTNALKAIPPQDRVLTLQASENAVETPAQKAEREAREKREQEQAQKDAQDKAKQEADKAKEKAKDLPEGTSGGDTYTAPKLEADKLAIRWPKVGGKEVLNKKHIMGYAYTPGQLSNKKATQLQFEAWYNGAKEELGLPEDQFQLILDAFVIWAGENGTSDKLTGDFKAIFNGEEHSYPVKPFVNRAQPTLRQIMMHFSDVVQNYIREKNKKTKYMTRWAQLRGLYDYRWAEYAFDFYEITPNTPYMAQEILTNMKAAALRNSNNKTLGLDGDVSTSVAAIDYRTVADHNKPRAAIMD